MRRSRTASSSSSSSSRSSDTARTCSGPGSAEADRRDRGLSVLVTHADQPIGRCLVGRLYHDERIDSILAVGEGPPPRAFDRYLSDAGARLRYTRTTLTRQRPAAELFRASAQSDRPVEAVIYVPRHVEATSRGASRPRHRSRTLSTLSPRTTEARIVLQRSLACSSIRQLVALGSAFVYRLDSGNSTRVTEESELDLAPDLPAEDRAWVDSDMLFHGELGGDQLTVALLRIPTVVGWDGAVHLNPALSMNSNSSRAGLSGHPPRIRPLGFDPMCALVAEEDVATAVQLALHRRAKGIFNVAGRDTMPLSRLERCFAMRDRVEDGSPGLVGQLWWQAAEAVRLLGLPRRAGGGPDRSSGRGASYLRYGFTLDTRRAEAVLGFRPAYRIGEDRLPDGSRRLDATLA